MLCSVVYYISVYESKACKLCGIPASSNLIEGIDKFKKAIKILGIMLTLKKYLAPIVTSSIHFDMKNPYVISRHQVKLGYHNYHIVVS